MSCFIILSTPGCNLLLCLIASLSGCGPKVSLDRYETKTCRVFPCFNLGHYDVVTWWPVSRTIIRCILSFPIGRCWPLIGCHNAPPMSLVTHVSSNHRCWYFHQPRPLMAKLGSHNSHWTQHSLDREKNKELFLAHFHVLRKSSDTKMRRKDNAQLSSQLIFQWRVPWCPSLTLTQAGSGSAQFPVLPTARENWSQGSGPPVLIYSLEMFLLA